MRAPYGLPDLRRRAGKSSSAGCGVPWTKPSEPTSTAAPVMVCAREKEAARTESPGLLFASCRPGCYLRGRINRIRREKLGPTWANLSRLWRRKAKDTDVNR